ncbi:hypothetical protein EVAR_3710_1 [Eumeta japonica]|uniref:Uncharacterized protein n=1 Tax=Eumeta variegata TaxID=151549 RepID=A0A4C1SRC2_EUMVA|nr:hypothetical protein EVAR_3710_1 [Eumeta japonica]
MCVVWLTPVIMVKNHSLSVDQFGLFFLYFLLASHQLLGVEIRINSFVPRTVKGALAVPNPHQLMQGFSLKPDGLPWATHAGFKPYHLKYKDCVSGVASLISLTQHDPSLLDKGADSVSASRARLESRAGSDSKKELELELKTKPNSEQSQIERGI